MLIGMSHWTGYTVFSVISGVLLVLMTFAPGLKPGTRAAYLLGGIALAAYGIYAANQTTGTYYFPVYIFLVPVLAIVTFFKAIGGASATRTGPASPSAARPVTRPVVNPSAAGPVTRPVANPSYANPTMETSAATAIPNAHPTPIQSPLESQAPPPVTQALPKVPQQLSPRQPEVTSGPQQTGTPLPPSALPGQKIVIDLSDLEDA